MHAFLGARVSRPQGWVRYAGGTPALQIRRREGSPTGLTLGEGSNLRSRNMGSGGGQRIGWPWGLWGWAAAWFKHRFDQAERPARSLIERAPDCRYHRLGGNAIEAALGLEG